MEKTLIYKMPSVLKTSTQKKLGVFKFVAGEHSTTGNYLNNISPRDSETYLTINGVKEDGTVISTHKGDVIEIYNYYSVENASTLYGTDEEIRLSDMKYFLKLKDFIFGDTASARDKFTGSIQELGSLANLQNLKIQGSAITGSIEDFAKAQVDNGRIDGEIYVYFSASKVNCTTFPSAKGVTISFSKSYENGYNITLNNWFEL